jgi:hypothetical protein
MKQYPCITQRRVLRTALCAATLALLAFSGGALADVTQSGEQKNMPREAYRPTRAAILPAECHSVPGSKIYCIRGHAQQYSETQAWLYFLAEPAEQQCG